MLQSEKESANDRRWCESGEAIAKRMERRACIVADNDKGHYTPALSLGERVEVETAKKTSHIERGGVSYDKVLP